MHGATAEGVEEGSIDGDAARWLEAIQTGGVDLSPFTGCEGKGDALAVRQALAQALAEVLGGTGLSPQKSDTVAATAAVASDMLKLQPAQGAVGREGMLGRVLKKGMISNPSHLISSRLAPPHLISSHLVSSHLISHLTRAHPPTHIATEFELCGRGTRIFEGLVKEYIDLTDEEWSSSVLSGVRVTYEDGEDEIVEFEEVAELVVGENHRNGAGPLPKLKANVYNADTGSGDGGS